MKNKIYFLVIIISIVISGLTIISLLRLIPYNKNRISLDQDGYLLLLSDADENSDFYINILNFSQDPIQKNAIDVWTKTKYPSSYVSQNGIDTMVGQLAINCEGKTLSAIQAIEYLNSQSVNNAYSQKYSNNFFSPPPGSNGEALINYTCNGQLKKDHRTTQSFWENLF